MKSQESHFDAVAELYDEALPGHVTAHYLEKRVRFIVAHCPPGRALDVGCGTGVLAARLASCGYEMVGLDPSEGMLEHLRRGAPGVRAVQGSGSELPFADAEFDLALTVAALHHIADPAAVRETLHEMVRVVRPGGRILIWDHNPRNPYWPIIMKRVPQDQGDERLVPLEEILGGLTEAGAEPQLSAQLGLVPDFTPRRLLPAAAALERAAERTPLLRERCAHNVVLAAKP